MRIKSLELKNIRSYVDEKVEFPKGNILFEGDIGSGKSTILLGIEFALFGLSADISGQSLLRMGQSNGEVTFVFEVGGKEYKIYRSISKKSKGIGQDTCYIIHDEQKFDLSPEEMRAKVLQILKFKESLSARSSSKIFRYAIFTPQEEIKTILTLKPTDRLQTLRKAFGLEDYKIAKGNTQSVVRKIKSFIDIKSGALLNLSNLTGEFEVNKELKKSLQEKAITVSKQLEEKKQILEGLEKQISEIQSKKEELAALLSQKSVLEQNFTSQTNQINSLKEQIQKNKTDFEELNKKLGSFSQLGEPQHTKEELHKHLQEQRTILSESQLGIGKTQVKIENYNSLISKGVCPTCEQDIETTSFGTKIDELNQQLFDKNKLTEELRVQIQTLENSLRLVQEYELKQSQFTSLQQQIADKNNTIVFDDQNIKRLEENLLESNKNFEEIKNKLSLYTDITGTFSILDDKKKTLNSELNNLISEQSSINQNIKNIEGRNTAVENQLKELDKTKKQKEQLTEKLIWLRDFFIPSLDLIEQHVMLSLNRDFDNRFKFWFDLLMENSEIRVGVDETFTPLIEQNGYSLEVNSLSGGEKTSVALAYRLSLNNLVKQVCSSLKSNLLIMDEPTDGFSKEQLFKIKDVLEELNCEQTIIVSHERELESFVDTIFKVEKEMHTSKIRRIS